MNPTEPPTAGSPLEIEPVPTIFCRLLLRASVAAGGGLALLTWGIEDVTTFLLLVFLLVVIVIVGARDRLPRNGRLLPVAASAGRVTVAALAVFAVITVAEGAGVVWSALCLGLSERVRARLRPWFDSAQHDRYLANDRDARTS